MTRISFHVDGEPKAQPRPRAFARKLANGKVCARVYDSSSAEGWKSAAPSAGAKPQQAPVASATPPWKR